MNLNRAFSKYENLWLLLFSTMLFGFSYLKYDFMYGWLDDVIQMNVFRGTYNDVAHDDAYFQHVFLGRLYTFLYGVWPRVPWYGAFMYAYLFAIVFLFVKNVRTILKKYLTKSIPFFVVLCSLMYVVLIMEAVVILVYTKVAILLVGLSLLSLIMMKLQSSNRRGRAIKTLALVLLCVIGFLTRASVNASTLLFFIAFVFLIPVKIQFWNKMVFVTGIAMLVLSYNLANGHLRPNSDDPIMTIAPYIFNLSDGGNINQSFVDEALQDKQDSIKYYAAMGWYFADEGKIDIEFLKKIGGKSFHEHLTFEKLKHNLKEEIEKSRFRYDDAYLPQYNYFWKAAVFLLINIPLLMASLFVAQNRIFLKQLLFFCCVIIMVLGITSFMKMEDRVFSTLVALTTVVNLIFTLYNYKTHQPRFSRGFVMAFLLIVFTPLALYTNMMVSKEVGALNRNLEQKTKVIAELKAEFKAEYIFLDLWSMTLLHNRPLSHVDWTGYHLYTFGEYWANFVPSYRESFLKLCGTLKFDEFYDCLISRGDQVVFLSAEFRTRFIESYFSNLYNKEYRFEKTTHLPEIQELDYSFIWAPIDFNYYRLRPATSAEQ